MFLRVTHKHFKRGTVRGFTLLEMMVTLVILSILGLSAWPAIRETKAAFDRRSAKNLLEFDLRRARSEALSKGVRIVITLASDGRSYTVGSDLLPYDLTTGAHDSLLFTTELSNNVTLSFSGTGANQRKLIFTSRGFLSDIAGNRNTSQRVATLSYLESSFVTATVFPVGVAAFSN